MLTELTFSIVQEEYMYIWELRRVSKQVVELGYLFIGFHLVVYEKDFPLI